MSHAAEIVPAGTYHRRLGGPTNAFRYGVDYVLLDLDQPPGARLLAHDRPGLFSIHRRDHGGPRHAGSGTAWVRETLASAGWPEAEPCRILLLTQPRFLGFWFCPVSFWLVQSGQHLRAVIAEVNNTFGERHSYLCAHPGFRPIVPEDTMTARKVFHVSPFQDVTGGYRFRFDITDHAVSIHIRHDAGAGGLVATLEGPRRPLTNRALLLSAIRRPFGAMRVLALIYWQAVRLRLKGARYRQPPPAPAHEISR
jgi:DUF1365 family protein